MKTQFDYNTAFSRNMGLMRDMDQKLISNTTVLVAGVGGDGGLLAERLVRFGIGRIILADPEVFEMSHLNRQYGSTWNTIGRKKCRVIADELMRINPNLRCEVHEDGIDSSNVTQMARKADIIVDEIEYKLPEISVMLHRAARFFNKHVFRGANIGWGASLFHFSPKGMTFEDFFQYNENTKTINPLAYLPSLPEYLDIDTVEKVLSGKIPVPAVASSVALVSAMLSTDVVHFATGLRSSVCAPEFTFIDLFEQSFGIHVRSHCDETNILTPETQYADVSQEQI